MRETLGIDLPNIDGARAEANSFRQRLESALDGLTSEDTSIALFGSLARDEFTSGSDVDWTVLIDGIANPKHLDVAREVERVVESLGARAPGREKIFGKLAVSHEIIHVPRFLLKDFARYWRTMAVDFAFKRRTRAREGSSIRNIKLRMSRKLIFVSGLLACFSGHILLPAAEPSTLISTANPPYEFVRHLRRVFAQTPLEIVASIINCHAHLRPVGAHLFSGYDAFLGVLRDDQKRAHLENLQPEAQNGDSMYQELRDASHKFRDAVLTLFFDEGTGLSQLTRIYGIF